MKNILNIHIIILVILALTSCAKKALDPSGYMQWVEDEKNGLRVNKQVGDLIFILQYKPVDYVVLQEVKDPDISREVYEKTSDNFKGMQYFTFRIKTSQGNMSPLKYNLSAQEEYFGRVEYFSFRMQQDIKLIDGKDTLNCALHHFERDYELTPANTFVLGFELPAGQEKNETRDKIFIYNDRVLGAGTIKIGINKRDINNIPTLKI